MLEPERGGVKEVAVKGAVTALERPVNLFSVYRVPDHRMADRCHVNTDLVRAAGADSDIEQ
jgi:hypothetical protein